MRVMPPPGSEALPVRRPSVAGSFYPADPDALADIVAGLLATAPRPPEAIDAARSTGLAGILVPHAGLAYSGLVAAAGWRLARRMWTASDPTREAGPATGSTATTIVLLGTNHGAAWLDGVGVWDRGSWRTPLGDVEVDGDLAMDIAGLGAPFMVDREAHRSEHSLEVQLPFLASAPADIRIVPLAVSAGTGTRAVRAGDDLGMLLADRCRGGARIGLAISTDMAHYPSAEVATHITDALAPHILGLDPVGLARREAEVTASGLPDVYCGMCGIEPTTLGLAALRAMGVQRGLRLAAATSADAGGGPDRTVGYLAVAFTGGPPG